MSVTAWLNRVGTAVPPHDIHDAFVAWADARLAGTREGRLFRRMAGRAAIARRWTVLPPGPGGSQLADGGFYGGDTLPATSARMRAYAAAAPDLAMRAIAELGLLGPISHLVVASCTGFVAPGIDQILAARLGLGADVERTLVGFMGCYAAVAALRTARHIVRSEPAARVLVVAVELSTLHLQDTDDVESLLAMMLFGDGAAAALVSARPEGFAIERPFSVALPDTAPLITWTVGDQGFAMHLSGEVPQRIGAALRDPGVGGLMRGDAWAVHAGGRSILDAVEGALDLPHDALAASRTVLAEHGNMSSATLLFVLARLLAGPRVDDGVAIAFGPGLAAEGFRFRSAA